MQGFGWRLASAMNSLHAVKFSVRTYNAAAVDDLAPDLDAPSNRETVAIGECLAAACDRSLALQCGVYVESGGSAGGRVFLTDVKNASVVPWFALRPVRLALGRGVDRACRC